MKRLLTLSFIVSLLALTGCATNPVTGGNNFMLYGSDWDISTGRQQYLPSQQSQGGEYVVDESLGHYVDQVGQRVAEWSDNPLPYEFVVLNNSVPNAWALPGGKIAINRGLLLELNNEAELAAVLGHEVVHSAARHGAQAMSRGALLQGALVVGAIALDDNDYAPYIVGASQVGAQLIAQRYGREAELESDAYGIRYMAAAGYDPRAAISLQETFVRLSEGRNQDWLSGLFSSHPPSEERVRRNAELVEEITPLYDYDEMERGEARYQQAIAHIRETAPAYELYDEAVAAINENEMAEAMNLMEQAIAIEPAEARFYGLQGDISIYQDNYRQAISSYDRALELHDQYFDYYLGRGVANARLGNRQQAKSDLERSADLLPTSIAANELGKLSLQANNRDVAKQYFQLAAQGQGTASQEASRYFARLDVADNPNNYIETNLSLNTEGILVVEVSNPLDVALRSVVVGIQFNVNGVTSQVSRTINFLNAGSTTRINTGMPLPPDYNQERDSVVSGVLSLRVNN